MFNPDKLSTMMGAPPNLWKEQEIYQMRRIHRAYRVAYSAQEGRRVKFESEDSEEEVYTTGNGLKLKLYGEERSEMGSKSKASSKNQGKANGAYSDPENYLPTYSALRSRKGDMKEPAHAPFRDQETFQATCDFEYWVGYFDRTTGDSFLVETGRGIIDKICLVQSNNQVRSKLGHVPGRKAREHIAPISLCLHEIKDWCISFLRETNPANGASYSEIKKRIKYIEGLNDKKVWGRKAQVFGQGMRDVAHERLFELLVAIRHILIVAEEYCYRKYTQKAVREKLVILLSTLKDCLLDESRVLSARFEIEGQIASPKQSTLQPIDLLNVLKNVHFIDFQNPANVLLYKLFTNKLVYSAFTDNYQNFEKDELATTIKNWNNANYFCKQGANEPIFLMDAKKATKILPRVYTPTAAELKVKVRKGDSRMPVPKPGKRVISTMKSAFDDIKAVETVFKQAMKTLAAMQDIAPIIYAVHELTQLSSDTGNFQLYETMKNEVNALMMTAIDKLRVMKTASNALRKVIGKKAELRMAHIRRVHKGDLAQARIPNFVSNHAYIGVHLQPVADDTYDSCFRQLLEVAKDAKDYSLTSDDISDKIVEAQQLINTVTRTGDLLSIAPPKSRANASIAGRSKGRSLNQDPVLEEESDDDGFFENATVIDPELEDLPPTSTKVKKKRWFN